MPGTLTVIWWRDIPAQVIAKDRRRASKVVLHPRFQVAIDKAADKAGRRSMDDYIAEWRKVQHACGDDLERAATEEANRLEAEYTKERLAALVASGGVAAGGAGGAAAASGGVAASGAAGSGGDGAADQPNEAAR